MNTMKELFLILLIYILLVTIGIMKVEQNRMKAQLNTIQATIQFYQLPDMPKHKKPNYRLLTKHK